VELRWPGCDVESCTGFRITEFGRCLAHLDADQLDNYLERLGPGSHIDARGTTFTGSLLTRLLETISDSGRSAFGSARFEQAQFVEPATFMNVNFKLNASFDGAEFHDTFSLLGVTADKRISFVDTRFAKDAVVNGFAAAEFDFTRARFAGRVQMAVAAARVMCESTRFEEGVILRLDGSTVFAEQAMFGATSSITRQHTFSEPPPVLSLRAADVSNLELVDVDLRWCRFDEARRLDQLRIAGRCEFNTPPASWRWTRRQTIVEEHLWRGWPTVSRDKVGPERVAALYRSLRKALEDTKNEAGAGDFYYGEMDARRHSRETRRTERGILWCYWLLSGYGQRAGRALIALLVLIATVAVLLTVWGQPAENAARIAVGAVVFRDDRTELTTAGEWTVLMARFLGPVLLALAVLAVRARVKR
jgi:hypothetical protein